MWAQIMNILIGLWVMLSPSVLDLNQETAKNEYIVGPLIVSIACISIFESVRNFRLLNILGGLWLFISPSLLGYAETSGVVSAMVSGILVIVFSAVRGKVENRFGGGWRSLFQVDSAHMTEADRQAGDQTKTSSRGL